MMVSPAEFLEGNQAVSAVAVMLVGRAIEPIVSPRPAVMRDQVGNDRVMGGPRRDLDLLHEQISALARRRP